MPDIEAIEVLTQAKERLFEYGWGRFHPCHRPRGEFCLEEAIVGVRGRFVSCSGVPSFIRAAKYINAAVADDWGTGHSSSLFGWNDIQESASPVFDAIDRAIEIAKESSHEPTD